jgi:NADP-dependent 3-hydroxy acid dehydrogenase YdfG
MSLEKTVVARRRGRLHELAATIGPAGGTMFVLQTDITEQEQAQWAVEQTVAELGRLDIVVNNAGIMLLGPKLDAPTAEWERMVALNVLGSLYVTHAALQHLVHAAEGSSRGVADLVAISSTAGAWRGRGAASTP